MGRQNLDVGSSCSIRLLNLVCDYQISSFFPLLMMFVSKEVQASTPTSSQSSSKSPSRSLSDMSKSPAGSTPSNEPQRSSSRRPSSRPAHNPVASDNQITRPPPSDNVIRGRQKYVSRPERLTASSDMRFLENVLSKLLLHWVLSPLITRSAREKGSNTSAKARSSSERSISRLAASKFV